MAEAGAWALGRGGCSGAWSRRVGAQALCRGGCSWTWPRLVLRHLADSFSITIIFPWRLSNSRGYLSVESIMSGHEENCGWRDFLGSLDKRALVCCIHGINRSPCGLASALARSVPTPEDAVKRIQSLRPSHHVHTHVRTYDVRILSQLYLSVYT